MEKFHISSTQALLARVRTLSSDKRALLAAQLPPVSFAQRRMWFLHNYSPYKHYYNLPAAIELRGLLDRVALEKTFQEIVRRHEVLCSNFLLLDNTLVQYNAEFGPLTIASKDLRQFPEIEKLSRARELAKEESHRPFDLENDRPLRITLVQLADTWHALLLTVHHIVCDGWSIGVLMQEFAALYTAYRKGNPSPLPELSIQYADYARWQRSSLEQGKLASEVAHWSAKLKNSVSLLPYPTDRPRPAHQSFRGAHASAMLGSVLSRELTALARRENVTAFMLLLAAWKVLLSRCSGENDILIGTPVAGRTRAEVEKLIGLFVNTVVIRTDLGGDPTFLEVLNRVRKASLDAFAHQAVPFEKLIETLQPERNTAYSPIFQVMFVLQNAAAGRPPELPGLTLSGWEYESGMSQFDLMLTAIEREEGFHFTIEYSTDLFDPGTVDRVLDHFKILLAGVASNPGARVATLPLLGSEEENLLRHRWQGSLVSYEGAQDLGSLFEQQVERTPEAIAVTCEHRRWSYSELDQRANQLARRLQRLGVGPEVIVGIAMERSCELLQGLLGILKAGGAYLPLELEHPAERLKYVLESAGAMVVVTRAAELARLQAAGLLSGKLVVNLDDEQAPIEADSTRRIERELRGDNAAYVIYTSGSTGKPKGVVNTHKGIRNRLLWMQQEYQLRSDDCVLQKTPYGFDVSVWEFFWPLLAGARLAMAEPGGHRESAYLADIIEREQVTTVHFVPSMLQMFLQEPDLDVKCRSLRRVISSGEALSASLAKDAQRRTACTLYNFYGPTEAAVDVTRWSCRPDKQKEAEQDAWEPIGTPIPNLQLYVLDEEMELAPIGVEGELYIGGVGVARGYIGLADLTAERFVPSPMARDKAAGDRLYRTGDRVRWNPEGTLVYLGRRDQQIKMRGLRIELGEIEAALLRHPEVEHAAATVWEEAGGDQRLVAYIVSRDKGATADAAALRSHVQAILPSYMIPAAYVTLPELPRLANGKLNRKRLPKPDSSTRDQPFAAPRTPMEQALVAIWKDILRLDSISVDDNFFHLGGHSLLATRVVNRVRAEFGVLIPLPQFFAYPVIARLALYVEQNANDKVAEKIVRPLAANAAEDLLTRLDGLSDEEVNSLLEHLTV